MKLSPRRRRVWRYLLFQLKKHYNPGVPVEVRTVKLKGIEGDCQGVMHLGRMVKIVIRINNRSPWKVRYDTLMHEWAHAMEWEANWADDSPKKDHGPTWGVWYASIYTHLVETCWEDIKARGLALPSQIKAEEADN